MKAFISNLDYFWELLFSQLDCLTFFLFFLRKISHTIGKLTLLDFFVIFSFVKLISSVKLLHKGLFFCINRNWKNICHRIIRFMLKSHWGLLRFFYLFILRTLILFEVVFCSLTNIINILLELLPKRVGVWSVSQRPRNHANKIMSLFFDKYKAEKMDSSISQQAIL